MRADQHCAIHGCNEMAFHLAKLVDKDDQLVEDCTLEEVIGELAEGHSVPLCPRDLNEVIKLANRLNTV